MKMDRKKLAAIALLIAIALSTFGFVYSAWTDYICIGGTVNMGSLTIVWDEGEAGYLGYEDNEGNLPDPKDIAWAEIYYDENSYVIDEHTGKGGYKTLILKIHNAYPCYEVHFTTLVVNNSGTIPAHFIRWIVSGYDETDDEELMFKWYDEYTSGAFWDNGPDDVWGTDDDVEIINVDIVNFVCHQLDPCHKTKGEIDFHFKQAAEECHTYTFSFTLEAVQWNKVGE